VEAVEEDTPEEFLDEGRVGRGERGEFSASAPDTVADQGVDVRVKIEIRAEGLDGSDHARLGGGLTGLQSEGATSRLVRRAGKEPEEPPFPLEKPPENPRNRENVVAVRNGN